MWLQWVKSHLVHKLVRIRGRGVKHAKSCSDATLFSKQYLIKETHPSSVFPGVLFLLLLTCAQSCGGFLVFIKIEYAR